MYIPTVTAKDCNELKAAQGGSFRAGVNKVKIGSAEVDVACDANGWTVIQSRGQFAGNPQTLFEKDWAGYKAPFGEAGKEHWIGLDNMYTMTNAKTYRLRVTLTDANGAKGRAYYASFKLMDNVRIVADKSPLKPYLRLPKSSIQNKFKLSVGTFQGLSGDSTATYQKYGFLKDLIVNSQLLLLRLVQQHSGLDDLPQRHGLHDEGHGQRPRRVRQLRRQVLRRMVVPRLPVGQPERTEPEQGVGHSRGQGHRLVHLEGTLSQHEDVGDGSPPSLIESRARS